ncbi:MAG: DEAD/DEAH box helicase family protein, partial [Actinobacteria bacterium]|nr:DEAD/DEAH box helicase family protein [Actinomycetota bacterium]
MSAPANIAQGQFMPVHGPASRGNFLNKTISLSYPPIATTRTLSEKTMSTVMDELQQYGQILCPNIEEGLRDLAEALEAMADGQLSRRYHLSSLDPGVGKTTMMKHFIRHLLGSPQHDDVSVMVCVSRIDEVRKMIEALSDDIHNVGVLIGKDNEEDVTAPLTQADPTEARVLITTQQMIERRCHGGRCFRDVSAFHHRGQPRQVRIWDEAFLPGQE